MDTSSILRIVNRNLPKIMAAAAMSGVVTTAVLAADGHLKAQSIRYELGDSRGESIANAFKARWKCYAPSVISGIMTISAIIVSIRTSDKRLAAATAAYSLSKDAYAAYRKEAEKALGEKKSAEVADKAVQAISSKKPEASSVIAVGTGEVLCYDAFSGRYFSSTMENIRRAENNLNQTIIHDGSVSLNEFYEALGLQQVGVGDELGWNLDRLISVDFGTDITPDGKPCLAISFQLDPIREWWKVAR